MHIYICVCVCGQIWEVEEDGVDVVLSGVGASRAVNSRQGDDVSHPLQAVLPHS